MLAQLWEPSQAETLKGSLEEMHVQLECTTLPICKRSHNCWEPSQGETLGVTPMRYMCN